MKKKAIIKILKIVIPIFIGIYLTWYFFSGLTDEEIQQTKDAFFEANYFWVLLGLFVSWLSHLSRAYRWRFLLNPMGYFPSLSTCYHAVMSGYVINFTVPRSGEIARAGLLTTYEDVPFEKSFATIVVERIIDVIMLGLVVVITGFLQTDNERFKAITQHPPSENNNEWFLYTLLLTAIAGIITLTLYFKHKKFQSFVKNKIRGFYEGILSVWRMDKKWSYFLHTFFIWGCYILTIWIIAQAFEETKDMPVGAIFGAFVVGAAAITILPGGIGAYPTWVNAVLVLYNIHFPAFGIFLWVIQTALLVVLGLLSLFLIQKKEKINPTPKIKSL